MDPLPGISLAPRTRRKKRGPLVFPISEIFGFAPEAQSLEAERIRSNHWCRFAETLCEKYRQYGMGYCSVPYAAADDDGIRYTYAVCDHRMDGEPLRRVLADHFGDTLPKLVAEVQLTNPKMSFDYVAFDPANPGDAIAVETQAIDLRGGGVGPAYKAWANGEPEKWREYFTREALEKKRKDNVAYGVNMANVYKRIGTQIAVKGVYLASIKVPMYVLMQDRVFSYLAKRIRFAESSENFNLTFITFDYNDRVDSEGRLEFVYRRLLRTTVAEFNRAMTTTDTVDVLDREDFLSRVQIKAQLPKAGST